MGLFSTKYEQYVNTTVSRVLPDAGLPNSLRNGFVKALFSEDPDASLPAYVSDELISSVGIRAERMYAWAKDHYVHGLPSGSIHSAADGQLPVEQVLATLYGAPVEMEYYHFGPPNNLHMAFQDLFTTYGYNADTNRLPGLEASAGDHPVYLTDIEVIIPAAVIGTLRGESIAQWGPAARAGYTPRHNASPYLSHTPYQVDVAVTEEENRVTYEYETEPGAVQLHYLTLSMSAYPNGYDYFQARFKVGGMTKFFTYRYGAGDYSTLDNLFKGSGISADASFFPLAYFRYNKVSEISAPTSQSYKDNVKLTKYLNLDFDLVSTTIDSNPNIGDIQQAMMIMAVPADSQNETEHHYLFEFFTKWWTALDQGYETPSQAQLSAMLSIDPQGSEKTKNTILIEDARSQMYLSSSGIFKRKVAGSIGKVGSCNGEVTTGTYTITIKDVNTGEPTTTTKTAKTYLYRKQTGFAVYEEIQVVGLQMIIHVEGDSYVMADEGSDILLIPLDRSLLTLWTLQDKETLYSRSLHYMFNSLILQPVKWYQSGWFQTVLIIVMIVITIYTYGSTWQELAAAIAAGTVTMSSVVLSILVGVFKYFATTYAVNLFVHAVGVETAFVVAILAALAGGYVYATDSVAGAPWAKDLLALSTNLSKGVGHENQEQLGELLSEASDFEKYVAAQTKTLDSAKDLLNTTSPLAPIVIFGESSTDFFNRTVHAGNIGAIGISAISNYVELALTLPKLNETIGGMPYGTA